MVESQPPNQPPTLALNTMVEADFVAPLTAVRAALEILRDFPDLTPEKRQSFVESALKGCARLEEGVDHLAEAVYAAGQDGVSPAPSPVDHSETQEYRDRIAFCDDIEAIEVDFSDFQFSSSKIVNAFHDAIDAAVESTHRKWYFLVNFRNCRVWPEAWIAFAHRGKKINASYSLGTVRYAAPDADRRGEGRLGSSDPDFFDSRQAAIERIEGMKQAGGH